MLTSAFSLVNADKHVGGPLRGAAVYTEISDIKDLDAAMDRVNAVHGGEARQPLQLRYIVISDPDFVPFMHGKRLQDAARKGFNCLHKANPGQDAADFIYESLGSIAASAHAAKPSAF